MACTPASLGSAGFKTDYGLRYAYLAGSMYRGIASPELVIRLARAGLMGFFGAGGSSLGEIEASIRSIQGQMTPGQVFGVNLIAHHHLPQRELELAELYLRLGVDRIEASAFMQVTPALVWYRLSGLQAGADGGPVCTRQIFAKVSRPEVAEAFLRPAPERMVAALRQEGRITAQQAVWAAGIPMSQAICVEADSGGHTDRGVASVLLPTIQRLRDRIAAGQNYSRPIYVGLGGGIGTPEAAAAAFAMGADYILTGSINQCTVEAGMSDAVKDLLQEMNVQDTAYAPAGDMFELGSKVQVLKKGVFFPARANKLFALYSQYAGLHEIPEAVRQQLEEKYFGRRFEAVWEETKTYLQSQNLAAELTQAERSEKHRMALVFRWYFAHSFRAARAGDVAHRLDFQIHTGPALGAFNQWVLGTELQSWRKRHVDLIAEKLMRETAALLNRRYAEFSV